MSVSTTYRPETLVAHADRGIDGASDVAPPIHQTAPFRASSDDEFAEMSNTPRHPRNYTRDGGRRSHVPRHQKSQRAHMKDIGELQSSSRLVKHCREKTSLRH